MSYITVAELRKPPHNLGQDVLADADAPVLVEITKDFIDTVTRQDFLKEGTSSTPVKKIIDGNGKRRIALPKRLLELKTVAVLLTDTSRDTHPAVSFTIDEAKLILSWSDLVSTGTSKRIRSDIFPKGIGNIEIEGVWGYETPPTSIKFVQGRLIGKMASSGGGTAGGGAGSGGGGFSEQNKSERLGDFAFTRFGASDLGGGGGIGGNSVITGDIEIDLILRKFRRWFLDGAV